MMRDHKDKYDQLSYKVIGCAMAVHKVLGPGLLESAYLGCMCHEMTCEGIDFRREVPLPVKYRNCVLDCGYRLDLVIESSLIVELKAVETILPVHEAQLLTYLKLSGMHTGLLINFNVPVLRDGIIRRVL
jgi:GxxExxY protein